MTPGILNLQEIESDFNLRKLNFIQYGFYQLMSMFRKFIIELLTLRTTDCMDFD